jgi:hypothetical protein
VVVWGDLVGLQNLYRCENHVSQPEELNLHLCVFITIIIIIIVVVVVVVIIVIVVIVIIVVLWFPCVGIAE